MYDIMFNCPKAIVVDRRQGFMQDGDVQCDKLEPDGGICCKNSKNCRKPAFLTILDNFPE